MSPAASDPDPLDHLTPERRAHFASIVQPVRAWKVTPVPDPVADLVRAYELIRDAPIRADPPPRRYIRWSDVSDEGEEGWLREVERQLRLQELEQALYRATHPRPVLRWSDLNPS